MSIKSSGKTRPSRQFEQELRSQGYTTVAGVDEAGRGPLAGPVVAASVVLPWLENLPDVNDSKQIGCAARERLFSEINRRAIAVGVGVVSPQTIDSVNILQATRAAMVLAVANMNMPVDYLLIDGPISLDLDVPQRGIPSGDKLSVSVAAASIVAKVTRDRIMALLHENFPVYGFNQNKGYPTEAHRKALKLYGPCSAHRKTFRGVLTFLE